MLMEYEYIEVPYNQQKDLMVQLNELCKARPGARFHSMGQKMTKVRSITGQPTMEIVLIMEIIKVQKARYYDPNIKNNA